MCVLLFVVFFFLPLGSFIVFVEGEISSVCTNAIQEKAKPLQIFNVNKCRSEFRQTGLWLIDQIIHADRSFIVCTPHTSRLTSHGVIVVKLLHGLGVQ